MECFSFDMLHLRLLLMGDVQEVGGCTALDGVQKVRPRNTDLESSTQKN